MLVPVRLIRGARPRVPAELVRSDAADSGVEGGVVRILDEGGAIEGGELRPS